MQDRAKEENVAWTIIIVDFAQEGTLTFVSMVLLSRELDDDKPLQTS